MLAILFVSDALLLLRLTNGYESSDVYVTFNESVAIIRLPPRNKYTLPVLQLISARTTWVLRLRDVFSDRGPSLRDGSTK